MTPTRRTRSPYGTSTTNKDDQSQDQEDSTDGRRNEWGEGYGARHGRKFQLLRHRVLIRDGYRCVVCGLTDDEHRARDDLFGGGLHVHHLTDVDTFDDPDDAHTMDNMEARCADCHMDEHR